MAFKVLNSIADAGYRRLRYDCLRNSYIENQNVTKFLFDIVFKILRRFLHLNRHKTPTGLKRDTGRVEVLRNQSL